MDLLVKLFKIFTTERLTWAADLADKGTYLAIGYPHLSLAGSLQIKFQVIE